MSYSLQNPGMVPVAWGRNDAGEPTKLFRKRDGHGLADGRAHLRMTRDERPGSGGRKSKLPLHSIVRDVKGKDGLSAMLRVELPEAHRIVTEFSAGRFADRAEAERAEERYVELCRDWRNEYLRTRRSDADSLYLQLETVASLGKIIEITYAQPTIEDAFPVTILNTFMQTARAVEKELTWELPAYGVNVSISGLPTGDMRRGERWYRLCHVMAGAKITDMEIRAFKESVANYPDDWDFDLWEERLRAAGLAVQFGAALTAAFGRPNNNIPGLFRNNPGIPTQVCDFLSTTPEDNLAAITELLKNQADAVDNRVEFEADSIAMSPGAFRFLSSQLFNPGNASNVFTMEMIMKANPWIKNVYQIREAEPNATTATKLQAHGMDSTEAEINSGGIRIDGTQRSAIVAYRRDPDLIEILKGFPIETTVYPSVYEVTQAQVIESVGGLVVHQPETVRIGYIEP